MIHTTTVRLHETRIDQFLGRLMDGILSDHVMLSAKYGHSLDPVPYSKRLDLEYKDVSEGGTWGGTWDSAWFELTGTVPAEWKGKRVVAQLDFNGEGLVFSDDGVPVQGLSNGSVFKSGYSRDVFPLFDVVEGGEQVSLWVEAAANGLFGAGHDADPPRNEPIRSGNHEGKVNKIRLCVYDTDMWHFWLDMDVLNSLMRAQEERSVRRARILKRLNEVIDAYKDDRANTNACREMLKPLFDKPAEASALTAVAVAHAHLDTGWLWPVRESIRKSARTFSSQIGLIEKYPDFVFGASQPQHYAFVKEHYPELYAKIKKAVADRRWEPQGGMWVECDCNIVSGESMVRQFVHGKNFFMDEFGFDVKNTWIPDVFGYSAAMPQIMRRAGVEYFVTQKMCWCQFNTFPYNTFLWQGIDGSEVLAHFPPENNYNSSLDPQSLRGAEHRYVERDRVDEFLSLFGIGDGGGGAKEEFVERGLRQKNLEGAPKVRFGRADEFFERIKDRAPELPRWVGELYLEVHRATYTTQARTKRGNRKLELKLRDTEYLCSLANLDAYPLEKLDGIWKTLLLNQFHDILPGSSIGWVYEVAEREYGECLAACDQLQADAAKNAFAPAADNAVLVNTLSYPYHGAVALPEGWGGATLGGEALPAQTEADGRSFVAVDLPANGIVTVAKAAAGSATKPVEGLVLENGLVRYEFAENGEILSAYDKECGRDVLAPDARGNVVTLYEDRPTHWDAWDIDIFYENQALETAKSVAVATLMDGPARQGLRLELTVGESKMTQEVVLAPHSKRLDFVTEVDWHERHRMLRVAFDVDVDSEQATFDIQYGFAKRPTHRNTERDIGRFEVAAQRYADLSDAGYGVALLNDCKYGYKILGNTIDMHLLRSPTHPHGDADQGHHRFTYSLYPHSGSLARSDVISEAAQLNCPPMVFAGYAAGEVKPPCTVEGDGVSLEVVKKAEKDECVVIRIIETLGKRTTARVTLRDEGAKLAETNLMEWTDEGEVDDGVVEMGPFEIRTFRIL